MKHLTIMLLGIGLSSAAVAEDFSYDYVSASYGSIDFDDLNVDGDGFGLGLSMGIAENFHLFADYQGADLDFGVDVTQFGAGIGYNTPISDVIDVVAKLSYEYVDIDAGLISDDDSGFGVGVGIRAAVSEAVEIEVGLSYVDLSDSGDNTAFEAGFLFDVTESISIGLSGSWDDDVTIYSLGGRMYFGD